MTLAEINRADLDLDLADAFLPAGADGSTDHALPTRAGAGASSTLMRTCCASSAGCPITSSINSLIKPYSSMCICQLPLLASSSAIKEMRAVSLGGFYPLSYPGRSNFSRLKRNRPLIRSHYRVEHLSQIQLPHRWRWWPLCLQSLHPYSRLARRALVGPAAFSPTRHHRHQREQRIAAHEATKTQWQGAGKQRRADEDHQSVRNVIDGSPSPYPSIASPTMPSREKQLAPL